MTRVERGVDLVLEAHGRGVRGNLSSGSDTEKKSTYESLDLMTTRDGQGGVGR